MFIDYLAFDLHGSCPQPPLRRRCNCGALPSGGTRREGGHPDGWGLRRRGPAGRCADRRSAFQAVPALLLRRRCEAFPGRCGAPALSGYVPRRESSRRLGSSPPRPCGPLCRPEVGVPSRPRASSRSAVRRVSRAAVPPLPSGGPRRDGGHPDGWGLRRRGPGGRCADRRSAFQAVPALLLSRRCGAFRGRGAAPALRGYVPRREPFQRLGSSPPRPCGPLCRPEVGVPSRPRASARLARRGVRGPRGSRV